MFLTIIVFILIFGLIVFVHELGHFVLAKRAGIKVEEFGFGFPPRILSFKKGETVYSLNLFPIGGFVKIHGEDGKKESDPDKDRAFYSKTIWTRAKILTAGVVMNFLLAIILLSVGYWMGLPAMIDSDTVGDTSREKIQITEVVNDSPAYEAGIRMGDTIDSFKLEGEAFEFFKISEVQEFINENRGQEIIIVISRGDEVLEKNITPRIVHSESEGPLGVGLVKTAIISYPWYQSLYKGLMSTISLTFMIIAALGTLLWQLITTGKLAMEIAGPVGIFNLTDQATTLGFIYVLQLTAILNIHIAIINILPFPALDGGRLVFLAIEKIKGSPVSQKIERIVNASGFIFLILLMLAVTWRDILKLF